MKNDPFGRLMVKLSNEVEQGRLDEAANTVINERRERIKTKIIGMVVALLYLVVILCRSEINDTVAGLFTSKESESASLSKLPDEINSGKADDSSPTTAAANRKAKVKDAMVKAKDHAALVDSIMDDNLTVQKPAADPNANQ